MYSFPTSLAVQCCTGRASGRVCGSWPALSHQFHSTMLAGLCSCIFRAASSRPGASTSSLSTKYSHWPQAFSTPTFRAMEPPSLTLWMALNRRSFSAYRSHTAPEPSGLPSSTITHSQSGMVWARMLSRQRGSRSSALYTGITMLTKGMVLLTFSGCCPVLSGSHHRFRPRRRPPAPQTGAG